MADVYSAVYDVIYVAKENQSVGGHCLLSYGVETFTPTPYPPTSNPLSVFCFPLPSLIRVYFFFNLKSILKEMAFEKLMFLKYKIRRLVR